MADQDDRRRPHFFLAGNGEPEPFISVQRGSNVLVPPQDRVAHGQKLMGQLQALIPAFTEVREAARDAGLSEAGLVIEFEGFPDVELAVESLSREASDARTGLSPPCQ